MATQIHSRGNITARIPAEYFCESAVATFIVSPAHEVVFWNKACETLTGIPASKVISTQNHWTAFYQEPRPCLADIVLDGSFPILGDFYNSYGKSTLNADGIRAEGWYENLGGAERYIIFDAAPIYNPEGDLIAAIETLQDITDIKRGQPRQDTLGRLRTTQPCFVPICASCKNIRINTGGWTPVETFFQDKTGIHFSHGSCPNCIRSLYPDFFDKITGENGNGDDGAD